ncbi:Protein kinase-like domain [Cinara cedri]|uniref:Protein kinase-like domain n=1 Tax=Cinara cedri TaxID=506608 RepID=A0A5E4NCI4_9HEMI|nr:Protein kinase-like domain [Cinara cedri]
MGFGYWTGTFCGTTEFIASEVLTETTYMRSVDCHPSQVTIKKKVLNSIIIDEVQYPRFLSLEAIKITRRLLYENPEKKLGSSERDAGDVKTKAFFGQVAWDDLLQKKVRI